MNAHLENALSNLERAILDDIKSFGGRSLLIAELRELGDSIEFAESCEKMLERKKENERENSIPI